MTIDFIVKTNTTANSINQVKIKVITFAELKSHYPTSSISHGNGKDIFDNHCAINVSDALFKAGIKLKSFQGVKCWGCPTPEDNKGIHAVRAQELANWLGKRPFAGCPEAMSLTGDNFEEMIAGKTGIVFFKDYWQREGQTNRQGDHIDLWDKNSMVSTGYLSTQFRLIFPNWAETFGSSDLTRSTQVLFWEIK